MIDTLDTYFSYCKTQMALVNSSQRFGGVIMARDWPLTPPIQGALYLLFLSAVPQNAGTPSQALYEYFCQWVWLYIGTDIQQNQQAANRGDRYRSNLQIIGNLRQANYPGFTRKMTYSADSQGNVTSTPVVGVYPPSAIEMIRWTQPRFMPKQDEKSGLVFGAAAVSVFGYSDVDVLVA